VAAIGVTTMLVPVTAPMPGASDTCVAPATVQLNVVAPPGTTVAGAASNAAIVGNGTATFTTTARVTLPVELVALRV
jgi:hypothetical protein